MFCCKSNINTKSININHYNLTEQQRIDYLNNLRQQIRKYYFPHSFEQAISDNKLAYDQGGELLEIWLQTLEERFGKNPSQYIL
jgi:hypothetical protein